ncbi:MAG: FAD-dependent oxidoreductase [Gemmatimonadota bacterium]
MIRLMLAGAGYAHLFVLEAAARGAFPGTEIVVVGVEEPLGYIGMLPGVVAGRLPVNAATIDLGRLVERARGRIVRGRLRRVDPAQSEVILESGEKLGYDLLSLSLDGTPAGFNLPGVADQALTARTLSAAVALGEALDRAAVQDATEPLRVVVVGGGPVGVELALAARARLDQRGAALAAVSIIEAGHTVLPVATSRAQAETRIMLRAADITLRPTTSVAAAGAGHLTLVGDGVLPVDLLIWATGSAAPALFRESGLPTESHGFLLVDETLRVPGQPKILASGEGAVLEAWQNAPKSAVSAVRQGRVLTANLAMLAADPDGKPRLARFRPRGRTPALFGANAGQAILSYDALVVRGAWVLKLKDALDRRFVQRFAQ